MTGVAWLAFSAALAASKAPESGHCQWRKAQAESQALPLLTPELFGSAGVVDSDELIGGLPMHRPRPRLLVGLRYSASDIYRGVMLRRAADAECRRHDAAVTLAAMLEAEQELGRAEALEAQRAELERASAEGAAVVAAVKDAVARDGATADELALARARLDGIRRRLHQVSVERAKVPELPPAQPVEPLLAELERADEEAERASGAIRASSSWDVRISAGYDHDFGGEGQLPYFGMLTLSYELGGPWQIGANARAAEGRQRWRGQDFDGLAKKARAMLERLRQARDAERARLEEVRALLGEMEDDVQRTRTIGWAKARRYRESVWFESVELKAERAYLEKRLEQLGEYLGETPWVGAGSRR